MANKGIIFTNEQKITRKLQVDKIQTMDDVRRLFKFLDISVTIQEGTTIKGFDEVKDLFGVGEDK